jgi:prepilin peptidase CpaA
MPFPIVATAVVFIGVCVAADLRTRRIPNLVTGPALVAGAVLNAVYGGYQGLSQSALGLLASVAILFVPFALGGIGGGDVKMMAALGAFVGPRMALSGLALGMILGGAIMIVHLCRIGRLGEKLKHTIAMFAAAARTGSIGPLRPPGDDPATVTLPYSVPLGIGTIAVLAASRAWR